MTEKWIEGDEGRSFIEMVEGEKIRYAFRWEAAVSITTATATVFRSGTDITSTAMPSGSHDITGDIITLKRLWALTGDANQEYVVTITATVDANTEVRKLLVQISHPTDAP